VELAAPDVMLFQRLGLALALGLLIGFERGWHERAEAEGSRVAGIRTFGLIGLLGGFWALLADELGPLLLGFGFLAFAAVLVAARLRAAGHTRDYGMTTVIAGLLTFALGAIALRGFMAEAAAGAVVTALLLGIKPILHGWLTRISYDELLAVLKLLVMSLVLLPVLPNRGYGPWQALNPYELWLMVVLIAGLSFVGYAAVRLAGARRGILLSSLAGGLVSSTAVTLTLSRLGRRSPARRALIAGGIGFACTTMYPRTLLVATAIEPGMLQHLAAPLGAATLAGYATAFALWRQPQPQAQAAELELQNPFEFTMALKFGLLLAAVMLLARGLQLWLGDAGIFALAVVSGLADVDAINLSLSRMAADGLATTVAAGGVALAVVSNSLVKGGIAVAIGGQRLAAPVALALGSGLAAGLAGYLLGTP